MFKGSIFHTLQGATRCNANTFFNNRNLPADPETGKAPKAELRQYQPGFSAGGPIYIPGLWDGHDKGFFFFSYEDTAQPGEHHAQPHRAQPPAAAQRCLHLRQHDGEPAAARGEQRPDLNADPVVAKLFADMRSAASQRHDHQPVGSDPAAGDVPGRRATTSRRIRPAASTTTSPRTTACRARSAYNHINSTPDTTNNREPFFPGFPNTGSQQSTRYLVSPYFRSTFGANIVNTFHGGGSAARRTSRRSSRRRCSAVTASATRTAST